MRLITTTGAAAGHLPPDGPERDELLGLVRIGLKFQAQHQGKRPGFLHTYLLALARQVGQPLSFERLLLQLAYEARRRELLGVSASPIEKIDREWEILTYHCPKRGRLQMPFRTLRYHLTQVKKALAT